MEIKIVFFGLFLFWSAGELLTDASNSENAVKSRHEKFLFPPTFIRIPAFGSKDKNKGSSTSTQNPNDIGECFMGCASACPPPLANDQIICVTNGDQFDSKCLYTCVSSICNKTLLEEPFTCATWLEPVDLNMPPMCPGTAECT